MTGEPEPGPSKDIHISDVVSAGPDQTVVVKLDARLTCTACGYGSNEFQIDFSGSVRGPAPRRTTNHDPGE